MSVAYYAGALGALTLGYITGGPGAARIRYRGITYHGDSGVPGAYGAYHLYSSYMNSNGKRPNQGPTPPNTPNKKQKTFHISDMAPMDVDRPVAAQLDHLPGGLSAKTCRVVIGGRTKYKSRGNMCYMYQISDHFTNAGQSPASGFSSGNQLRCIVGGMLKSVEFTRKETFVADSFVAMGKNVFNLNPNQLNTGSGYSDTTTVPYPSTGTHLTFTPGLVPKQDYINWKSSRFIYDIVNLSTNPLFGTFYVCKAKRDLQGDEGPIQSWTYQDMYFKVGPSVMNLPNTSSQAPGEYAGSSEVVHTVPTSSLTFNQNWEVVKVTPCNIANGGTCKVKFDIEVNRTYDRELMEMKGVKGIAIPKGAIEIMFVGHGGPIWSTVTNNTGVRYGWIDIGVIATIKHNFGFVDREKHWRTYMQYSNQIKDVPLPNQKLPAQNTPGGDPVTGI